MPFVRLILPLGLVVFGAAAAYMGLVVLATSLGTGEISVGYGSAGSAVVETARRADDPAAFWRRTILLGVVPAALGIVLVIFGWGRHGR